MKVISKYNEKDIMDRGYCLAPIVLVEEKKKVRFMYREEPDNSEDSGWRFFSGDETDEYVNNSDNIGLYDVSTVARIDKSIISLLDSPYGKAFEREDASQPFTETELG